MSSAADAKYPEVARALGIEIIEGAWPDGASRRLDDVQQRFAVSRTVAREAIQQLENLRLVSTRRRVGATARPRTEWATLTPTLIDWRMRSADRDAQLASLTALRGAVEPVAAAAAARAASPDVRALLPPLAAQLRTLGEAGDLEAFLEADIRFHREVLCASGNEMFAAIADLVEVILRTRTELGLMPQHPEPEALDGHEAMAHAIWSGDAEAARRSCARITDEIIHTLEHQH